MIDYIEILHIDDDPDFADITARYLEGEDDRFSVETATSGTDGLARLTSDVDCVVSDYEMPGMDGIELIAAVREERPDLPVILFTGKGSEAVASDAISAGVTDYLQKQPGSEQYELLAARIRTAVGQYRAERELDRQNDLFEKTQDLTDVGAWEYVPADDDVYFTEKVYDIYGVDPDYDPEPEKDLEKFYHPADRDTVREAVERAWEAGEPYDIESRITAADGTEKWIRTLGDPVFEDGRCERVRGTIWDITDRKEWERELEQTKEWYRALLNAAPDAVFVADADSGEICETNRAATQLLGRSREEIVGRNRTALHPPDESEAYAALFEAPASADTGRDETPGEQAETHVVDADGERIPVEIHAQTVEIDGQRYNQGYVRDITERKLRERALTRQNERLDGFASVVSHDLRNPLEVILGRVEYLRAADDGEHLAVIDRAARRMDTIITDLLTLSRVGDSIADRAPVDLAAVARAAWATVDTGGADLEVALAEATTVEADRTRLVTVFENLFHNSVEHGPASPDSPASEDSGEHDAALRVRVEPLDPGRTDGGVAGFAVEDDGVGVPTADRDAVFDHGYTTDADGTGFGLSIVAEIVEAHGWEISVTAGEDGGARFEIRTAVSPPTPG